VLAGEEQKIIYDNSVRHLKNEIEKEKKESASVNKVLREQHHKIIKEERDLRDLAMLVKEAKDKLKDDPDYLESKKKREEEVPMEKFDFIKQEMEKDSKEVEDL